MHLATATNKEQSVMVKTFYCIHFLDNLMEGQAAPTHCLLLIQAVHNGAERKFDLPMIQIDFYSLLSFKEIFSDLYLNSRKNVYLSQKLE